MLQSWWGSVVCRKYEVCWDEHTLTMSPLFPQQSVLSCKAIKDWYTGQDCSFLCLWCNPPGLPSWRFEWWESTNTGPCACACACSRGPKHTWLIRALAHTYGHTYAGTYHTHHLSLTRSSRKVNTQRYCSTRCALYEAALGSLPNL